MFDEYYFYNEEGCIAIRTENETYAVDEFISYINHDSPDEDSHFYSCFQDWFYNFKLANECKTVYVGFLATPPWFKYFIQELNSMLENISIEVVREEKISAATKKDPWGDVYTIFRGDILSGKLIAPLVKIKFSPHYSSKGIKFLSYVLVIFIRMASYLEKFLDFKNPDDTITGSYVQYFIDLNNHNLSYRSFTEGTLAKITDIKLFDNIDLINQSGIDFQTYSSIAQTEIIVGYRSE